VSGYTQPTMVAGPIQYKRKYTLWVLILLVIVCWPAAIIYFFTRDKVPVQEMQTYATPVPMQTAAPLPASGGSAPYCPKCGNPATWVPQSNRWYCQKDQQYL
jgi:hypothetical protein